jgi:hypothetical protein
MATMPPGVVGGAVEREQGRPRAFDRRVALGRKRRPGGRRPDRRLRGQQGDEKKQGEEEQFVWTEGETCCETLFSLHVGIAPLNGETVRGEGNATAV